MLEPLRTWASSWASSVGIRARVTTMGASKLRNRRRSHSAVLISLVTAQVRLLLLAALTRMMKPRGSTGASTAAT